MNGTVQTDISKLSHLFISPNLPTLILPLCYFSPSIPFLILSSPTPPPLHPPSHPLSPNHHSPSSPLPYPPSLPFHTGYIPLQELQELHPGHTDRTAMCGVMSPGDLCQWYHLHPLLPWLYHGMCRTPPLCEPHQWLPGVQLCSAGWAGRTGMCGSPYMVLIPSCTFQIWC